MGFGDDIFPVSGVDADRWSEKAIWLNVPWRHREMDVEKDLRKLLKVFQDELDGMRLKIQELPLQLDPYVARGQDGEGEEFTFLAKDVDDAVYGASQRLCGLFPLSKVGVGWTMRDSGLLFETRLIRSRNYPQAENEIWIRGDRFAYGTEHKDVHVAGGNGEAKISFPLVGAPLILEPGTIRIAMELVGLGNQAVVDLNGDGQLFLENYPAWLTSVGMVDYDTGMVTLDFSNFSAPVW